MVALTSIAVYVNIHVLISWHRFHPVETSLKVQEIYNYVRTFSATWHNPRGCVRCTCTQGAARHSRADSVDPSTVPCQRTRSARSDAAGWLAGWLIVVVSPVTVQWIPGLRGRLGRKKLYSISEWCILTVYISNKDLFILAFTHRKEKCWDQKHSEKGQKPDDDL